MEIKSGYGLTVADEVRALYNCSAVHNRGDVPGRPCRTGRVARTIGRAYVDLVTGPMLEAAAPYGRWIDVFCEPALGPCV